MLQILGFFIAMMVLSLWWNWSKIEKKWDEDNKRRNEFLREEHYRKKQMENLEYQLKSEQLEALRRQNKKPPRPPLEPV